MQMTSNGSSNSSAVKSRSGSSPPETFRLPRSNAVVEAEAPHLLEVEVDGGRQRLDEAKLELWRGNATPAETSLSGSG